MSTPRAVHPPPIPAPTRPNLLSSVPSEPRPSEGRWQFGIEYQPPSYARNLFSVDPCGDVGEGTKATADGPSTVTWDPYWIGVSELCSTFQEVDTTRSRAVAALEAQTSHEIERILWTNTVDSADFGSGHANVGLSDATLNDIATPPTQAQIDAGFIYTPNSFDAVPITTAFKDMIDALADQLGGARGMIHVEKRLLPSITYAGLAVQNGNRLLTTLGDHIVVAGTGYTGSSPEEGAASENYTWIYGTSMVEVLLSPIETFAAEASEIVNRTTNVVAVYAERLALAHWDRQAHIGIGVCIEDPFGDCSDAGS